MRCRYFLIPLLLLTLVSCQQSAPLAARAEPDSAPLRPTYSLPIPQDRSVDDLSRFLAGLPGQSGSPFQTLETSPEWVDHAAQSTAGWKRFLTQRQPKMRDFAASQLTGPAMSHPVLFYPFGGPDIMTAQTLYPLAQTYVLVGLEPPGSLPDAAAVRSRSGAFLAGMRAALGSILNKSFFVTREMDQQLRGQVADGLLPVMLVELVRNGNTVRGLRYIGLGEGGKWSERQPGAGPNHPNDGVAVEFADAGGAVKTLVYLSMNLGNDKYKDNAAFHQHLAHLAPFGAMFKSTSYMPHRDAFALIRSQVLEKASAVVQDDSGIPYRFFDAAQWDVKLYGDYDKPYGSFRYLQQQDLREAFTRRESVGELPFSIGYGFGRMKSNLLVARRRPPFSK